MSSKDCSFSPQHTVHIIGSFDQSLTDDDFLTIQEFISKRNSDSPAIEDLKKLSTKSRSFSMVSHWKYLKENCSFEEVNDLSNRLNTFERQVKEREIVFSLVFNVPSKNLIKKFCTDYRIKPNDLILKLFYRHLNLDLLNLLPEEFSLLLARNCFYENVFEPELSGTVCWLSDRPHISEEARLSQYFTKGETGQLTGKLSRALKNWSTRDCFELINNLSFIKGLAEKRKITSSKVCPYLIPVHIYSCAQESLSAARQILQMYKDLFGDLLIIKVMEIFLDLLNNNFKRAVKNLGSLQFYHKNFHSDTFFILLCKYWCNGVLNGRELERLKQLLEDYSNSENALMKFEVQSLYKEVIGAGDLIESQLLYKHRPFAVFLKTDKSIFDILEEDEQASKTIKRLIWLINFEAGSVNTEAWVEIEPALQEKGKSGSWKTPELAPWKVLMEKEFRSILSTTDKKVINLLKDSKETLGLDFSLPENEALKHLINAENVYLEEDPKQRVTFEEVNPVIEYHEESERQYFQWKFPLSPGALHLEEIDDNVFELCILNKKLARLKEQTVSPLQINNSKDELVEFFKNLPENLVVEGDANFSQEEYEIGKTEILGRIIPCAGKNYRIQLLSACSGMTSIPGEGRKVLSLKKNDKEYVWERDKEAEIQKVSEVSLEANLDFDECILPFEWELSNPEEILSVIESFNNNPDLILQWPRGGKIKVASSKGGRISVKSSERKNWFAIEGSLVFDKGAIKLSEVIKSFKGNNRFIEISKNEYLALTKDLMKGLNDILTLADQRDECLELHAALADTLSGRLKSLSLDVEEEFIFRDCVTRMIYSKQIAVDIPDGLNAQLRPYQQKGYKWLVRMLSSGLGVCLADDMGLGKTVQTLSMLLRLKQEGPSLIIAPTSLCHNWAKESSRFTAGLNVKLYRGTERQDELKGISEGDLLVTSYGLVLQDIDLLREINWNVVVLDEAQMVKNSGTLRSKAIKLLQSKSRVALSGTPVENHVGELWNLFDWLNPGFLGTRSYFQDQYALPIEKNISGVLEKLKEKVKPFILRRLKKNVLKDLPDSQETILYIDLNKEEKEIYNASKYLVAKKLNSSKREKRNSRNKIEILAEITRLRKITSNFELSEVFDGISSKTEAVMAKVKELVENDHQALLFSQFTSHLDIIEANFKDLGLSYSRLDGSMNARQREKAVTDFNSGESQLMLISLKAGGFGLNLTAAEFVMHLDPWWNPAVEEQASARAIRIGQKKKVNVLRFITASSIEEEILKLHAHKKNITEDLLRGTSKASQLTVEDLMNLIK